MIARINGENGWKDPHNGGTYTLMSGTADSQVISTKRLTGDGKYTDLQKFTLTASGSGCSVSACSESQVFSILDYSTNFCDLHNLWCGSQDGCPVANTDLKYTETINSCKSSDKSKCVVKKASAPVLAEPVLADSCKKISTASNFSLDQYISGKWYIHQQMAVSYLPASQNFCVTAEYTKTKSTLFGYTVSVHNHAEEKDGKIHDAKICAASDGSGDPAKLEVAPCFLPKFAAGPYWILEFNQEEGYALVSGGQPTKQGTDGCRTGSGVNGSGLWIFLRTQQRDEAKINKVRALAKAQGFDLSVLNDVDQTNCKGGHKVTNLFDKMFAGMTKLAQ